MFCPRCGSEFEQVIDNKPDIDGITKELVLSHEEYKGDDLISSEYSNTLSEYNCPNCSFSFLVSAGVVL